MCWHDFKVPRKLIAVGQSATRKGRSTGEVITKAMTQNHTLKFYTSLMSRLIHNVYKIILVILNWKMRRYIIASYRGARATKSSEKPEQRNGRSRSQNNENGVSGAWTAKSSADWSTRTSSENLEQRAVVGMLLEAIASVSRKFHVKQTGLGDKYIRAME